MIAACVVQSRHGARSCARFIRLNDRWGEIKSLLLVIVSAVLYVDADDKAAQTVTLDELLVTSMSNVYILDDKDVIDEE